VAVITGSASGLGRAIAVRLAQEGAHVVVSDVRPDPREGGEPTEAVIEQGGGSCVRIDADVSRWEDVDRLVSDAVQQFGRLDVMVNNAAIAGPASKPLLETTEEDWDEIMAVNLRGVFLCCKRAIPEMLDQQPIGEIRGRVINISSQHGMVGSPGNVAYSTSKGGVINLHRRPPGEPASPLPPRCSGCAAACATRPPHEWCQRRPPRIIGISYTVCQPRLT
jgi:NAD(P)-dependent dehydrogenase (short-subunit alcohol dehydrogenase family)